MSAYSFFESQKSANGLVKCTACRHYCLIAKNGFGICGARKNIEGKLVLLTFAKPCSISLDPIEKKPLFHYLPASTTMSIGFFGCNFRCSFCQNFDISTTKATALESAVTKLKSVSPSDFVSIARKSDAKSIAFTYNEPAISVEYNLESIKLAKKGNKKKENERPLGTIYVSNGYETKEQIKALSKKETKLDAINIDLKSFNEDFYWKTCGGKLEEVLSCIKDFKKAKIWVELTTLLIPKKNNSPEELKQIASFIASVDKSIPWHVTSFFPMHNMLDPTPTKSEEIMEAVKIGKEAGLRFVYGGNLSNEGLESTHCPHCNSLLIKRKSYYTEYDKLVIKKGKGKCGVCGEKIEGIF
ncbi:MAG: AmmeMemoRadiSam system radical SAM enzyme [archaeon]